MENENGQQPPVDTNLGISRRTVLRRGAVVGGSLVWAAPAVQSISRTALADHNGTPHPPRCPCQFARARGIFVHTDGTLATATVLVGSAPPDEQIANANVLNGTVTAEAVTVTADASEDVCHASAEILNANVDLRNINALLDVQLFASILRAESTACPDPACTSRVADVRLTVAGIDVSVVVNAAPNSTVVNFTDPTGALSVRLVLNEQEPSNGGCRVRALHLTATLRDLLTGSVIQDTTVIISEAETG